MLFASISNLRAYVTKLLDNERPTRILLTTHPAGVGKTPQDKTFVAPFFADVTLCQLWRSEIAHTHTHTHKFLPY